MRYLKYLILLLLFAGHSYAGVITSGSVTQANMRLSAVDGTAFVDFSAADVLTDYVGRALRIKDSAGRIIKGWIKAAGSGETYGSNLFLNNTDFASDEPPGTAWTRGTGWTISGGKGNVVTVNANSSLLQDITLVSGWLTKQGFTIDSITGSMSTSQPTGAAKMTDSGAYSSYWTSNVTGAQSNGATTRDGLSTTAVIDDIYWKQVLTPSATGVTIVSTSGGATYNWKSQESGFNYNDASGYTYEIRTLGGGAAW